MEKRVLKDTDTSGQHGTSTEWRNDEANIEAVRLINDSWAHFPFSHEHEEVLDHPPYSIAWATGPNVPVDWKGGASAVVGDDILLSGGLWMPGYQNLAYAFNTKTETYTRLPDPIYKAEYTQGAGDAEALYIVSGRTGGNRGQKLARNDAGEWEWAELPSLPESESRGRSFAAVEVVGDWLILSCGNPQATPGERPDYRLRLDDPNAEWQPIPACPCNGRHLVVGGVIARKLYIFGGVRQDPYLKEIQQELATEYQLSGVFPWVVPWNADVNFRDAYAYDPDANEWAQIRGMPAGMLSGDLVTVDDRYGLIMGSSHWSSYRVGTALNGGDKWRGYSDMIFCYDAVLGNYSRIGVLLYGVATSPWVEHGGKVYSFGGEPAHGHNLNTENVLQIGTLVKRPE